jgi:hypothetical protein
MAPSILGTRTTGVGYPLDNYFDFPLPGDFFALLRSAAIRFSVRFFAAASDAILARAERSSADIVTRLLFPPIFPPLRPSSAMISESSALFSLFIQPS